LEARVEGKEKEVGEAVERLVELQARVEAKERGEGQALDGARQCQVDAHIAQLEELALHCTGRLDAVISAVSRVRTTHSNSSFGLEIFKHSTLMPHPGLLSISANLRPR